MSNLTAATLFSLALVAVPALAAGDPSTLPAQAAATEWLKLTDLGRYMASWEAGAKYFKSTIGKANWDASIRPFRGPLGGMKERKLESANFTRSLPGAPDGEYVVILYTTRFTAKAAAKETVTLVHEEDGSWKVTGYFIN